jgi:hypothetical protein
MSSGHGDLLPGGPGRGVRVGAVPAPGGQDAGHAPKSWDRRARKHGGPRTPARRQEPSQAGSGIVIRTSAANGLSTSHAGLRRLGPGLLADAINATETLLRHDIRQCLEPITATKLDSLHADLLAAYEDVARQASRDMGAPLHSGGGKR